MSRNFQGESNSSFRRKLEFDSGNSGKSKKRKVVFSFAILAVVVSIIFHRPILLSYGEWLAPSTDYPDADIAAVLYPDGEEPVKLAAELLKNGRIKAIYIDGISESKLKFLLEKYNIPINSVFWGGCKIPTTFDHAQNFKKAIESRNFSYNQVLVIFKKYQLRRTQWVFYQVLGSEVVVKTLATPTEIAKYNRYTWWEYPESSFFVRTETQKFSFYFYYYGLLKNSVSRDIEFQDATDIEGTKYDAEKYWKQLCEQKYP